MNPRLGKVLLVPILLLVFVLPADANIIHIRSNTTDVFFEKDGVPYDRPIDFEIKCYGYSWEPGKGVPSGHSYYEIISFSASCPEYGCTIDNDYRTNYLHIEDCDLKGVTEGGTFLIEDYADRPVPSTECDLVRDRDDPFSHNRKCKLQFDISSGRLITDSFIEHDKDNMLIFSILTLLLTLIFGLPVLYSLRREKINEQLNT